MRKHFNIPIFIPHLGCPFDCIFCDQKKIAGFKGAPKADEIRAIVEEHLATIPADAEVEVAFFGGNFTAVDRDLQESYLKEVLPYIKAGRVSAVRISTRPDCIDAEILEFLKSYQVKTIELGVQSLHDEVLKASRRGYRACDVFKACHLIKEYKLKLGIQLMIGLPEDDYSRSMESARLTVMIKPDMVRIYPTLVIAGTSLEKMLIKGEYKPLTLKEAVKTAADMFLLFNRYDIEVIRMGLQPSEELRSEGVVAAGPFHPAFGELVEQEIFRRQGEMLIKDRADFKGEQKVTFFVNSRDVSKMVGNKKSNIRFFEKKYGLSNVKVKAFPFLKANALGIGDDEKPHKVLSRQEFLQRLQE